MAYSKKDIEDFFKGRLSKKEAENFMKWLDSPEGEKEYKVIIEQVWFEENKEIPSDHETMPKVRPLKIHGFPQQKVLSKANTSNKWKTGLKIAASLLLVFAVSLIFYLNPSEKNDHEVSEELRVFEIIKSTPKGNKKKFSLPDGSTVVLNSASTLTYSSNFIQNRSVILEGEGFFDVVRDAAHPFTVITGNISTTALGTSFNIRAYEKAPEIQVSLATGKVRVENTQDNNLIEINPGEAVDFSTQNQILNKKQVDISKVLNWKEGILHFDKVPFHQVVLELERWYDVKFSISGKNIVTDYKCTGTFKKNEYLDNVLNVLSYSLDFEYEIQGDHVEIKFN